MPKSKMKNINWDTYKFHPSGLSNLMTNSRKKDEALSETSKSYLQELWINEVWGREKSEMVGNKYTQKGIMCETDSLELVEKVTGKRYFKNQTRFENDYIIGTPDVTKPDLIDIKTSWDLFTFMAVNEDTARKDYYTQVLSYMWLLGHTSASIFYCLVNTPEIIKSDEMYRLSFKLPEEEIKKYENNYIFDDIPEKERIKLFHFNYDEAIIEQIKVKIIVAREYLKNIKLNTNSFEEIVENEVQKYANKEDENIRKALNVPADWGDLTKPNKPLIVNK